MLLAMCHRCALCRSVTTCSVRREVAPLPSTEASLFRSEGREGREKEKKSALSLWQMQLAIGFCF